jgi:hypothetical protein
MTIDYNFTPINVPNKCPVCLELFEPISGRVTPYFLFFDGKKSAHINMCFDCATVLFKKIQEINPEIVAD